MRSFRPPVYLLALTLAGCAFAGKVGAPDPETRLEAGLAALAEQDMSTAQEHLEWVYRNHPSQPIGLQALPESFFTRSQFVGRDMVGRAVAQTFDFVGLLGRHQLHFHALAPPGGFHRPPRRRAKSPLSGSFQLGSASCS